MHIMCMFMDILTMAFFTVQTSLMIETIGIVAYQAALVNRKSKFGHNSL